MALDARFQTIVHSVTWEEALRCAESGFMRGTTRTPEGYRTVFDNGYTVHSTLAFRPRLVEKQGSSWTPPPEPGRETL